MPSGIERVDQLPLPSLHWYAGFSGLALFYAAVYALATPEGLLHTLFSDVWCEAAVLNMGCCCLFLLTNDIIYYFVFGSLQHMEQQHMRDKFWNFVFYKFIFVFGVMNVQEMQEMLCWCGWFAVLGTLLLTEQLCKDRFQFLSFSPNTPASSHAKIIVLLVMVFLSCAGLFMVCAIVGWQYGFNHFTFLYSEVFILFARTMHTIIRYIIHLWDMHHDGPWENRSTYTYYAELILELAALCVDFMHHVHMLLWANMFLSVASLILLMKLRFLYQEIQRRLKRHRNYVLVSETLENRFTLVKKEELMMSDETCAICWERMATARRLPCGHLFHMGCLRSWLEQDTVCPTCRRSLSDDLRHGAEREEGEGGEGTLRRWRGRWRRNMWRNRNWLLHFNGASIASWLPTFSLELHQEDDPRWIGNNPAELHRGAQQVHSMFPHIPLQAITLNLADTHSVSLTVEHILNDTIYIPGQDDDPSPSPLSPHTNPPLSSPHSIHTNSVLNDSDSESTASDSSTSDMLNNSASDSSTSDVLNNSASDSSGDVPSVSEEADVRGGGGRETSAERETPDTPGVGTEDSSSIVTEDSSGTTVEMVHSAGNCMHQHEDGVTTNTVRHRNIDRGGTSSEKQSCNEGELQTTCSFGVDPIEAISGESEIDHVTAPSDSRISVVDASAEGQDDSSSPEMNMSEDAASQGASSPSPLSTPSPYSFASLQQRKQKLLLNARRLSPHVNESNRKLGGAWERGYMFDGT